MKYHLNKKKVLFLALVTTLATFGVSADVDFNSAKLKADAEHKPLIVVYNNDGCHWCDILEEALGGSEYALWLSDRDYISCISREDSAKEFAKGHNYEYPFVAVYWNRGEGIDVIKETFTGRDGKMPISSGSLISQFIYSVDYVLSKADVHCTNDNFADAHEFCSSDRVFGSNTEATIEKDEPFVRVWGSATTTVWWKWTASDNGTVTFDTIGSGFDTVMGVYTGETLGSLEVVAEDDDGAETNNASRIEFSARAGITYYIAVAGNFGASGNIMLNKSFVPLLTETVGGYAWTYRIMDGKAEIYNNGDVAVYPAPEGNLTIPSILGGRMVSGIGDGAFQSCMKLRSVIIPNSVESIGCAAFDGCFSLEKVYIPNSIKRIEQLAFSGCSLLPDIRIPDSVTYIGFNAFAQCLSLTNVTLSAQCVKIEDGVFRGCGELCSIVLSDENAHYKVSNGLLLSKDGSELIAVAGGSTGSVDIPTGVIRIKSYAFCGCNKLDAVSIPDSVVEVGSQAFLECNALIDQITHVGLCMVDGWVVGTNWEIPESVILKEVRGIADSAFNGCSSLLSVEIQDTVKYIGSYAFSDCPNLRQVILGDGIIRIGYGAFHGCNDSLFEEGVIQGVKLIGGWVVGHTDELPQNLDLSGVCGIANYAFGNCGSITNVAFSSRLKSIGEQAFVSCHRLSEVMIPAGLSHIGSRAFANCTNLHLFTVAEENSEYKARDGLLLSHDGKVVLVVPSAKENVLIPSGVVMIGEYAFSGSAITNLVLPVGLKHIEQGAFCDCTRLSKIVIPDGLEKIDDCAFSNCINLESVIVPQTVSSMGEMVFRYCHNLKSIYLPRNVEGKIASSVFGECSEELNVLYYDGNYPPVLRFTYTLSDSGEATITGASNIPSVLEIPSSIDGHPVVAIGSKAFQGWCQIKEIIIPDTVRSIGAYAFQYCDGVERIVFGKGIVEISQWAFSYCKKIKELTLPDGFESIHEYSFAYCEALTIVILPKSLKEVRWGAFANNPALLSVYFHASFKGKGSDGKFEKSPNVRVYYYNCSTPNAPPAVKNLSATTDGPRVIRLAWEFDSAAEVSVFRVYRSRIDVFTDAELLSEIDSSEGESRYEYDDVNVEEDTDYYYWVVPHNDLFAGELSEFVIGSCCGPLEIVSDGVLQGKELVDFEQVLSVVDDRATNDLGWYVDDYSILPPGIELSWDGVLSGVPIQCGTYTFTVRCWDWCFGVEATAEITIDVAENDNRKPEISAYSPEDITDVVLTDGATQIFSVSASDPDGGNIHYVWMVDGEEILSGPKARALLFDPSDYDDDPWGHEVTCYVNDDLWENIVCRKWKVYVPPTLYVDAVNGDDANDGLTPEMAFASLDVVCQASPYTTIYVAPGTYLGGLFLDLPVSIVAQNGEVVIDADGMEHCVRFHGGSDFERRPVVRGCVLRNGYEAAAHVDLDRCVIVRNSETWMPFDESDPYYEVDESCNHGVLYDCVLTRCTIAGNVTMPERHPLMAGCTYDDKTIIWGNGDEADEVADPVFVSVANGDCRLRTSSPYVAEGVAVRGALDDVFWGYVLTATVDGPGKLDKMIAAVEPGRSVTFSVSIGSHPVESFKVDGEPVKIVDGVYTFNNVLSDIAIHVSFVSNVTFYVDAANGNDDADGFSFEAAVATLQTAIDRTANGDTIIVADGVYGPIETCNRKIVIRSENGYKSTVIDGGGETNCALLGGPETFTDDEQMGYGVLWQGTNTVLRGFTLRNGRAAWGAGVTAGTVENCLIVDNIVQAYPSNSPGPNGLGGGAYRSVLRNCTIVGNASNMAIADDGEVYGGIDGGCCDCTLFNCIEWGNADDVEVSDTINIDWWKASTYENCCRENPCFINAAKSDYRLHPDSPAILDGIVVMGCEFEIATSAVPQITEEELTEWVVTTLAVRYANENVGGEGYLSRFRAKFGTDLVAAFTKSTGKKDMQGNDMYVWQDYIAGTDPTDTNSLFTATITMDDGVPVVEWSPKLSVAEEAKRIYTVYGKASLESGEDWHSPTNSLDRFFTIGVEMK